MATEVPLTLHEDNDETIELTITPEQTGDTLAGVTVVELYLKVDRCEADTASGVLKLTSANPAQILVTSFSASQIEALAFIPASALASPYDRFWRVDALAGATRRTAMYGDVTVIDL